MAHHQFVWATKYQGASNHLSALQMSTHPHAWCTSGLWFSINASVLQYSSRILARKIYSNRFLLFQRCLHHYSIATTKRSVTTLKGLLSTRGIMENRVMSLIRYYFAFEVYEICQIKWSHLTLLDKVMPRNQWHIRLHQRHLMVIYGHKKEVCLEQNISIGSHCMEWSHFMLHFTTFIMFPYRWNDHKS